MTPPFPLLRVGRAWLLALLLAVIAAHAVSPLGGPLERAAGSAFSAATADVAVKAGPALAVAKRIVALTPTPLIATLAIARASSLPVMRTRFRVDVWQTGPPAAETSFSPLAARAPPAA
jgi:hypothetical protein